MPGSLSISAVLVWVPTPCTAPCVPTCHRLGTLRGQRTKQEPSALPAFLSCHNDVTRPDTSSAGPGAPIQYVLCLLHLPSPTHCAPFPQNLVTQLPQCSTASVCPTATSGFSRIVSQSSHSVCEARRCAHCPCATVLRPAHCPKEREWWSRIAEGHWAGVPGPGRELWAPRRSPILNGHWPRPEGLFRQSASHTMAPKCPSCARGDAGDLVGRGALLRAVPVAKCGPMRPQRRPRSSTRATVMALSALGCPCPGLTQRPLHLPYPSSHPAGTRTPVCRDGLRRRFPAGKW